MVIKIEIKPNRASRFIGRTVGRCVRTVGAGVTGFKRDAKAEWQRTSPPGDREITEAALAA